MEGPAGKTEEISHKFSEMAFPILTRVVNKRGEVVWEHELKEPGPVQVPALRQIHGPVGVQVKLAYQREWSEVDWG